MSTNPYSSPRAGGNQPRPIRGRWQPTLLKVLLGLAGLVILIALLLPNVRIGSEASHRIMCNNNLKQIGFAMQSYLDANGVFPPAYVADAEGKPMHSWRVLILPHMEADRLYQQYDESQPWDSEANRKLLGKMPATYHCPTSGDVGKSTSYVVVRGKDTIFDADQPCPIGSIIDGTAETILVVEAPRANIPWTEPRDLDFDQLSMQLNDGPSSPHSDHRGVHVLFADGSVRMIQNISPDDLRALLTKAGRDKVAGKF